MMCNDNTCFCFLTLTQNLSLTIFTIKPISTYKTTSTQGLYIQSGASSNTRRNVPFTTVGDAVLHKYDVMHGVNVQSGVRCSLVLWFCENEESMKSKTVPWVIRDAKSSVHAAFLFAHNSQNGLLGFNIDLETAKQYYSWASRRGHALSEYKLWLMEEGAVN